jgi:hypothetical protein
MTQEQKDLFTYLIKVEKSNLTANILQLRERQMIAIKEGLSQEALINEISELTKERDVCNQNLKWIEEVKV